MFNRAFAMRGWYFSCFASSQRQLTAASLVYPFTSLRSSRIIERAAEMAAWIFSCFASLDRQSMVTCLTCKH
ncbi:hypothetical protein BT96DRAFT_921795 [Gymnopus androsaceus JB14]|uniref:Uncharacterized protein n=1 Tax=Gymnopus androsaceus JB14 TaxID=1447944 RepID=A0A6A4HH21_9AGAR|nr:hypothetical protein BT96DRAFT_921795 [Gymnopus androsaceus JB14]